MTDMRSGEVSNADQMAVHCVCGKVTQRRISREIETVGKWTIEYVP